MLRFDILFKGISIMDYIKMVENIEQETNTENNVKECKIIERDNDTDTITLYVKMKMTAMSERDQVLKMQKISMPDGKLLIISQSTSHPDYPLDDKIIRIESFKASMLEQT